MTFAREPWAKIENEIRALTEAHWDEIAVDKDKIRLAINWAHYQQCEANGTLVSTTARENGELCGYFLCIVAFHPHYMDTKFAFQDAYFMLPEHRDGMNGVRFFLEAEKNCKDAGASKMIAITKAHYDLSDLFVFCGWKVEGITFGKWIGGTR